MKAIAPAFVFARCVLPLSALLLATTATTASAANDVGCGRSRPRRSACLAGQRCAAGALEEFGGGCRRCARGCVDERGQAGQGGCGDDDDSNKIGT